jgi:Fe-S-cluster containining protein
MADFPCSSCGECCKRLRAVLITSYNNTIIQELVNRFPYKAKPDGSCEMLNTQNQCSVYTHRPLICNIKVVAMLLKKSEQDHYKLNAKACNEMIKQANLDEKYLIKDFE